MDKSTSLLVKGAAIVVIIAGITTIFSDELRQQKNQIKQDRKEKQELKEIIEYKKKIRGTKTDLTNRCKYAFDEYSSVKARFYKEDDLDFYHKCRPIIEDVERECLKEADYDTCARDKLKNIIDMDD